MNTHGIIPVSEDIDRQVYEQILSFIRLRVTETYAYPPESCRWTASPSPRSATSARPWASPRARRPSTAPPLWRRLCQAKTSCITRPTCPKGNTRCCMWTPSRANATATKCWSASSNWPGCRQTGKRTGWCFSCCGSKSSTMRLLPTRR